MNSASPPPDSADSGAEGISKSPDDSPLEDAPSIDRPPGSVTRINLERRREGHPPRGRDVVATEEPLEVRIRYAKGEDLIERAVAVTMRTPGDDFDLATGFLYSEGVVESAAEIAEISHCTDRQNPQLFNIVTVTLRPGVLLQPHDRSSETSTPRRAAESVEKQRLKHCNCAVRSRSIQSYRFQNHFSGNFQMHCAENSPSSKKREESTLPVSSIGVGGSKFFVKMSGDTTPSIR